QLRLLKSSLIISIDVVIDNIYKIHGKYLGNNCLFNGNGRNCSINKTNIRPLSYKCIPSQTNK
ncbi:unnamed protein product, partial [Rotaria sp. Silwood1]